MRSKFLPLERKLRATFSVDNVYSTLGASLFGGIHSVRVYLTSAFIHSSAMDGHDTTNFFSVFACLDTTLAISLFLARVRKHAPGRRVDMRAADTTFFPVALFSFDPRPGVALELSGRR
jgi:hypothetical protein